MFSMAHLHLLANHLPILGSLFITALFLVALVFKNTFLQKVSLWFLVFIALATAVTYVSGDGTKSAVMALSQTSDAMIAAHEQAARFGLGIMFVAGVLSLGGVLFYSRRPTLPLYYRITVLIVLIVSIGILTYVSYLGGLIMHPEIRTFIATPLTLTFS